MRKLIKLLIIPIIALFLSTINPEFVINSYADSCADANNDGYCDTCGRSMNVDVIVDTKNPTYKHQHTGVSGTETPNGCYQKPTASTKNVVCVHTITDVEHFQDQAQDDGCAWCGGAMPHHGYISVSNGSVASCSTCPYNSLRICHNCWRMQAWVTPGSYPDPNDPTKGFFSIETNYHPIPGQTVSHYVQVPCTIYTLSCTQSEADISYGYVDMIKNESTLRIAPRSLSNCSITGYSWRYGGSVIGTGSSITITSVGTYTCVVSYSGTYSTGTVTLTYNASVDAITNNAFNITATPGTDNYGLSLNVNPDVASMITVTGYTWTGTNSSYTWDILPAITTSGNTQTIYTKNCGSYSCKVTYKGNSNETYTKTVAYGLTEFDPTVAKNLITQDNFSYAWTYFNLQNQYNQAECINFTNAHGSTAIKTVGVPSFNASHLINSNVTIEETVKTYPGVAYSVSEVIEYVGTFEISNVTRGTCADFGSSTLTGNVTANVYLRNDSTNVKTFCYSKSFNNLTSVIAGAKNVANHVCGIKSQRFVDTDGDNVSDYIMIVRDCPAQAHNYEIWHDLSIEDSDDGLIHVDRTYETQSSEFACQTVSTTVTYKWLPDDYKTYSTVEHRRHVYTATYTPATCTTSGIHHYDCRYCDYEYDRLVNDTLGHKFVWTNVSEMTMTQDGIVHGVCERCGFETDRVIPCPNKYLQQNTPNSWGEFTPNIIDKQGGTRTLPDRPTLYYELSELFNNPSTPRSPTAFNGSATSSTPRFSILDVGSGRYTDTDIDFNGKNISTGTTGVGFDGKNIGTGTKGYASLLDKIFEALKNAWEAIKQFFEKLIDKIKDLLEKLLGFLKNLLSYFKEHPLAMIASIIVLILIIVGIVILFIVRRDKKKSEEDDDEKDVDNDIDDMKERIAKKYQNKD